MIKRSLLGGAKIGFVFLLGANSIVAARWDEIHTNQHWPMILSAILFIAALEFWSYWGLSLLRAPESK